MSDSDGGKAGKGSTVTLTFSNRGTAVFNAVKPDENFTDNGTYRVARGLISISLPQLDISVTNRPYTLTGTTLILPFKVFSEGAGTSTWSAPNPGSGSKGEGTGPGTGTGTGPGPGPGTGTGPGTGPGPGTGTGTGTGHGTGNGPGPGPGPAPNPNPGPGALPDSGTISKVAGLWQGWGASYEVRFRRNNMMSVSVKHAALFSIGVNSQGVIKGGGVIAYDLDPNLCGVANLVKYTNWGINVLAKLPEFWQFSKEIGEAYKLAGEATALAQENAAHQAAKVVDQEAVKQMGHEWEHFLTHADDWALNAFMNIEKEKLKEAGKDMVEKMGEDDKKEEEEKKRAGCTSVGPGTLGEASAQVGASAIESLPVGPNMPMGVPMVPGVTQVQFNYKGLEHGPEERLFKIEGSVGMSNGETKMVLKQSGDVFEGSKDLMVVYQVNYKTDKKPFPAWSPFTNKPGAIWISNGPKTQKPPEEVVQLAQKMGTNLSTADGSVFAYMEDTGTHRNGVKPWQEYEYVWFVQKLDNQKVIQDFSQSPRH